MNINVDKAKLCLPSGHQIDVVTNVSVSDITVEDVLKMREQFERMHSGLQRTFI